MTDLSKLQKLRAQMHEREQIKAESASAAPEGLEDHLKGSGSKEPNAFVDHVKGLSAQVALDKLTIKQPKPKIRLKDGNKFRCPHHDHEDSDPSAWMNTETREWYCGSCESGGDWTELAAATLGFRNSKGWIDKKADWPSFIDKLKAFLGWEDPKPAPVSIVSIEKMGSQPGFEVKKNASKGGSETPNCQVNWRKLLPEGTFLRTWMEEVTKDDAPEEFHFASGLLALGLALGLDVGLSDAPTVYGNLFVCILGDSGSGKSKSGRLLKELLHNALPYKHDDPTNKGAALLSSPASGEVLYKLFSRPVMDPTNDKRIAFYAPVRGLVDYPELAGLVSRSSRTSSTVKASLIDLYDNPVVFSTESLTRGKLYAESPFGCMLTTTQPGVIQELMTKSDDKGGFLNRIVFVTGTEKPQFSVNRVKIDVGNSAVLLRDVFLWSQDEFQPGDAMEWSAEAEEVWDKFFRQQIQPDKKGSANDLTNRMDLLMKKLILLFTANRKQTVVPLDSVLDAMECYEYFMHTYGYTGAQLIKTSHGELEDKILMAVKKIFLDMGKEEIEPEKWPTPRDVLQKIHPRPETKAVKDALSNLADAGYLQAWTPQKKIGRPTVRYAPSET